MVGGCEKPNSHKPEIEVTPACPASTAGLHTYHIPNGVARPDKITKIFGSPGDVQQVDGIDLAKNFEQDLDWHFHQLPLFSLHFFRIRNILTL